MCGRTRKVRAFEFRKLRKRDVRQAIRDSPIPCQSTTGTGEPSIFASPSSDRQRPAFAQRTVTTIKSRQIRLIVGPIATRSMSTVDRAYLSATNTSRRFATPFATRLIIVGRNRTQLSEAAASDAYRAHVNTSHMFLSRDAVRRSRREVRLPTSDARSALRRFRREVPRIAVSTREYSGTV